jgi:hypothetical protein
MRNSFVRRKAKPLKTNAAVHPFVIVAMIAAISLVVFMLAFLRVRF